MLEIFNALIACLITTITLYIAGTIIFGKSKNTTLRNILAILVCTTLITIIFINMNGILKTILMYAVITLVLKYIFNINFSKAILFLIMQIIILMIPELLVLFFTTKILQLPKETIYTSFAGSVLGNVCTNFLTVSIIFTLRRPLKKLLNYNFSTNKKIIIVSIVTITITVYFFFKLIAGYKVNNSVITYLMCMIAFITILLTLYREKIENESIIKKYDELLDVMKTYEIDIENQRTLIHENRNELMTIRSKAIDKNASKEFIEYMDSVIGDKVSTSISKYSKFTHLPSNGLKGFFYYKSKYYKSMEAERRGIKVSTNVSKKIENSFLKDLDTKTYKDLARLIGVYLDNAIDASEKSEDKKLGIEIYLIKENIKIIITNTFSNDVDLSKIGKERYTTKGKNHGHGLLLVSSIIRNNNRFIAKTKVDQNLYIQELTINKN